MKFFLLLSLAALSTALSFDGDQVLTLYPKTTAHLQFLKELEEDTNGVDFWSPDSAAGVRVGSKVDVRFTKEKLNALKTKLDSFQMKFEVKVENLQDRIFGQFDRRHARGRVESYEDYDYYVYHTYDEIEQWMKDTADAYPALAKHDNFATTFENRKVNKLTLGSSDDKPIFLIDCGVHAREWVSPAFCQYFVNRMLTQYEKDDEVTRMMDEMTWIIIPVLNADGYVYTWTNDRLWRKTRSNYGTTCTGVDANRNFDKNWSGEGASTNPCSNTYCGPSLESEPIVKALSDFIRNNEGNIKGYIAFHSYSQIFVYPYSYAYVDPVNNDQLYDVSSRAAAAIKQTTGKEYTFGPGHQSLYLVSGGSKDMALDHSIPLSWTVELRDTGEHGFLLPESQIQGTCEEMFQAMIIITEEAITNT